MKKPSPEETQRHNGERLRALREAVGMTQTDLAARVGQTSDNIHLFEQGERRITASELWAICAAMNKRPHEFFDGEVEAQS
ncbi:MAG: helix-turn-helix transcriptional regulator [Pseudomonadota bacterium]